MNFRSDFLIEFGANSIVDIPFLLSFQEVRFNETIIGFPPPNGRFIASRNVKMPKFSRAAPLDPPGGGGLTAPPRPPSCFTRELRSLDPRFARSGPSGQFFNAGHHSDLWLDPRLCVLR